MGCSASAPSTPPAGVAAGECTLGSGDGGVPDFERGKSLDPLLQSTEAAKDAAAAAAAYCAAASAGHVEAVTHLAILFHVGEGVRKDLAEADRLYELAANAGSAHAKCNLATLPSRTPEQQLALTREAAELGHLRAMTNLGSMYEAGVVVEKDLGAALEWWRKAAAADFAIGQFNVGIALRDGLGTAVDRAESVAWLTKAADQGYGLARYNLAVALCEGEQADHARAAELYRCEAVANGDAAFNLAVLHMGRHPPVPQDWAEVARWARRAEVLMPHHEKAAQLRRLAEAKAGAPARAVEGQASGGGRELH